MGPEETLRDAAVRFACERHAVPLEVLDRLRGALCHHPHRRGIGEPIALGDGVGGVLLPRVVRIDGGQRGVDAARCQRGVCVGSGSLADQQHIDTLFCEFDGRAQPRPAGADDKDGCGDLLFMGGHEGQNGWPGAHSSRCADRNP